jgi:hypothetical protein
MGLMAETEGSFSPSPRDFRLRRLPACKLKVRHRHTVIGKSQLRVLKTHYEKLDTTRNSNYDNVHQARKQDSVYDRYTITTGAILYSVPGHHDDCSSLGQGGRM